MSEENTSKVTVIEEKLRNHFAGKIVRKDLTKRIKEGANVPVYVLEYLLGMYCSTFEEKDIEEVSKTSRTFSPRIMYGLTNRKR